MTFALTSPASALGEAVVLALADALVETLVLATDVFALFDSGVLVQADAASRHAASRIIRFMGKAPRKKMEWHQCFYAKTSGESRADGTLSQLLLSPKSAVERSDKLLSPS